MPGDGCLNLDQWKEFQVEQGPWIKRNRMQKQVHQCIEVCEMLKDQRYVVEKGNECVCIFMN